MKTKHFKSDSFLGIVHASREHTLITKRTEREATMEIMIMLTLVLITFVAMD